MRPPQALLFLMICALPHSARAFDYSDLHSEASVLQEQFSSGRIDVQTYLRLLRDNTEKLSFQDVNIHLLKIDLADAKKQVPPDASAFFARLDALALQEKLSLQPARPDQERMAGILRRREFRWEEEPRYLEVLLMRLLEFLRNIFGSIPYGEPLVLFSRIVTIISLIALVALLAYLIWRYTRPATVTGRPPESETLAEEVLLREPAHYWRLGEEAQQRGESTIAARHYFHAILSALHHGGVIRYEISRTNGEYWRMFQTRAKAPEELKRLQQSIQAYENYCYGNRAANPESASAFRENTKFFLDRLA